jgi:hypothetical protein
VSSSPRLSGAVEAGRLKTRSHGTNFQQSILSTPTRSSLVSTLWKNLAEAIGVPVRALLHVELNYDFSRAATNEFAPADLRRLKSQNRSDIAKIDRSAAALRAAQQHLATCLGRLSARETKRNAVAAQVKDGGQTEIEVLLLETHVAAARLAVFDAQIQVQHTLGSLEDAVQQPVELFLNVRRTRKFGNNSSGEYTVQTICNRSLFHPTEQRKEK